MMCMPPTKPFILQHPRIARTHFFGRAGGGHTATFRMHTVPVCIPGTSSIDIALPVLVLYRTGTVYSHLVRTRYWRACRK